MEPASVTDWISALSSFGAMVIAGVTAYLAYRQYLQPPAQIPEPTKATQDADDAQTDLVVFDTSKQQTVLRAGASKLECWLKDKRAETDKLQWSLGAAEMNRILAQNDLGVEPGFKAQTGRFRLGKRRNWLYSKKLFPEPDYLMSDLREVLKQALAE